MHGASANLHSGDQIGREIAPGRCSIRGNLTEPGLRFIEPTGVEIGCGYLVEPVGCELGIGCGRGNFRRAAGTISKHQVFGAQPVFDLSVIPLRQPCVQR